MGTLKHRWKLLAVVSVVSLFGSVLGGAAFAAFSDIGSSPFETEINNIANAGCATGFPGGLYKPQDPVNRQQMAGFLNRCGGRAGQDANTSGAVADANSSFPISVQSVDIDAGAAAAGTKGFVVFIADANIALDEAATACPCEITVKINVSGCTTESRTVTLDAPNLAGDNDQSVSVTEVCPINALTTLTGTLQITDMNDEGAANPNVRVRGQVAALYFPFGPHGTNAIT